MVNLLFGDVHEKVIDLNESDVFIRRGFDKSWIHALPVDTNNWIHLKGRSGSRSLVIRELGFKGLPQHTFLSPKTYPEEPFTFVTSFNVSRLEWDQKESLTLLIRGVGYGWEIFVNGQSVSKKIHTDLRGKFSPRRGHMLYVHIPHYLIKPDNNILTYKVIGDPAFYGTGFYYGKPYLISQTDTFYPRYIKLFSLSHFAIYIVIALIWAYLYIRQPKNLLYLQFSLLAITFSLYNAVKAVVEIGSGAFSFISFRIEYFSIFSIALMFALVLNTYLKYKTTRATLVYCCFCGTMAVLSIFMSPNFIFDTLRLWQYSLPLMSGYVFYLSLAGFIINRNAELRGQEIKKGWVSMPRVEGAVVAAGTTILLITVLADAIDSLTFRYGLGMNRVGFLICVCGMAGVLFNRYIRESKQVEEWSETLEKDLKKTIQTLNDQRSRLQKLSSQMLHVQEEERKHLSQEIHDDIGQAMTSISVNLESIRTDDGDVESLKAQILACQELVEETINKIHYFSQELRPPALDTLGLIPALRSNSKRYRNSNGLVVNVSGDDDILLSPDIKIVLYRIYQECLNNIIKHSNANMVNISLTKNNGKLNYIISDNGQGFDYEKVSSNSDGLGILGINERIKSLGGNLIVNSIPGEGTTITIELPESFNIYEV